MRVYTEAEKCKRSSSSIFVPLPPPSPGRQKSLNHSSIWQERRRLGTRFLLDADDDRGPEGLGHLREQEPFYTEQVAGSARSVRSVRSAALPSLYEYIEHLGNRATMLHPY